MNWNTLTVQQYQDIYNLNEPDELTKTIKIICILYGKTEAEVDSMDLTEFNKLSAIASKGLAVDQIPGSYKSVIRAGKNKYRINYAPSTLKLRQYVELQQYAQNPIQNMHLLMASIVEPIKYFIPRKNNVDDHEKYAADMLNAKVVDVYHSCVFFCKLYRDSIENGRKYLVESMTKQGMTETMANEVFQSLISTMDGFIPQNKLQSTKELI